MKSKCNTAKAAMGRPSTSSHYKHGSYPITRENRLTHTCCKVMQSVASPTTEETGDAGRLVADGCVGYAASLIPGAGDYTGKKWSESVVSTKRRLRTASRLSLRIKRKTFL